MGLEQQTEDVLNTVASRGRMSQGDITKEQMQGVPVAGQGLLKNVESETNRQSAALGGNLPEGFAETLGRRAQRGYQGDIQKLEQESKLASPLEQARRSGMASKALLGRERQKLQESAMRVEAEQRRVQSRANIISGLLGSAGAIAGTAAGAMAGPGGAKAGGQMGGKADIVGGSSYSNYGGYA